MFLYIYLYISIYLYLSGLYEPLSWSILCVGVSCSYQRIKKHYDSSLWFIVDTISLPLWPCISALIRISIPHPHLLPLSLYSPSPFPIFPQRLPQARKIQPRLFPPLIVYPRSRPPLRLQTKANNRSCWNVMCDCIMESIDASLHCLQARHLQGFFYWEVSLDTVCMSLWLYLCQPCYHPMIDAPQ